MKQNNIPLIIIIIFFSILISLFFFGPMQRTFAPSPRTLLAESPDQIATILKDNGVKGRILISFTRYLNSVEKISDISHGTSVNSMQRLDTSNKMAESLLQQGIIRRIYHVAPDNAWQEIHQNLSRMWGMRPTQNGFIGLFGGGRVYIQPYSRFSQIKEKALVIIEPNIWSPDEQEQIARKLTSGEISSDLIVIIRGDKKDIEKYHAR